MIEVERRFTEHQEEQAQLALMAQRNRDHMMEIIASEENKIGEELDKLSKQKEIREKKLVADLRQGDYCATISKFIFFEFPLVFDRFC